MFLEKVLSPLDRRDIQKSLKDKGFVLSNTHHGFWHFYYKEKKTSIRTWISHGASYKVYGDQLLNEMKRELELDRKKDLEDLIKCPMSEEDYIKILKDKGKLKE